VLFVLALLVVLFVLALLVVLFVLASSSPTAINGAIAAGDQSRLLPPRRNNSDKQKDNSNKQAKQR
jgi:hypothetical protein